MLNEKRFWLPIMQCRPGNLQSYFTVDFHCSTPPHVIELIQFSSSPAELQDSEDALCTTPESEWQEKDPRSAEGVAEMC